MVITHVPLLIAALASVPALLICPFLPGTSSAIASSRLRELREWHCGILSQLSRCIDGAAETVDTCASTSGASALSRIPS
jgi:hypothetical protein